MLHENLQAAKTRKGVNCLDLKMGPLLYIGDLFSGKVLYLKLMVF